MALTPPTLCNLDRSDFHHVKALKEKLERGAKKIDEVELIAFVLSFWRPS